MADGIQSLADTTSVERPLRAFYVDPDTLYAAASASLAAALYASATGRACAPPDFPREVPDDELDAPQPHYDAHGARTERFTTIHEYLQGAQEGFLVESFWGPV